MSCNYNARYNRGKLPFIPTPTSNNDHSPGQDSGTLNYQAEVELATPELDNSSLDISTSDHIQHSYTRSTNHQPGDNQDRSFNPSPEPAETDLEGHYVGPSSGVSFILSVQKRLQDNLLLSENTSIFTFGDSQLPKFDPSFLILPSKIDAEGLVVRFFDFAFPTHRFLHQPTVEMWMEELYINVPRVSSSRGARDQRALILMVFAQATAYTVVSGQDETVATRDRYEISLSI